jgi:octaprenyl-diphosphate synthase
MKVDIKEAQRYIAPEMKQFEERFSELMRSKVFLLDKIMGYIVKRKGKQLRPLFVLLTAKALHQISDATYRGAALIELLHTATLVHDDVVDDANYRRGFFSVNALWKNKIAVLVGDYLLSRGLLLAVEHKDFALLEIVSNAVREMSEGELLQIEKARRLDITEEVYFQIIRQKTASLIASCCAVGAASAGGNAEQIEHARRFGELVGIAFQIKDDLFDYGDEEIGKPRGIDIKEKKMTLPLIYALNTTGWLERQSIIATVKKDKPSRADIQRVIDFVKQSGGLTYAKGTMQKHVEEALQILVQFANAESAIHLNSLVHYTIEREK